MFQPVIILWSAAKGRKDPQLKKRKALSELNLHSFGHMGATQQAVHTTLTYYHLVKLLAAPEIRCPLDLYI